MYKTKAASMMRGAKIRALVGPRPRVPVPKTDARTKPSELIQFGSTTSAREAFFAQIRPLVRQARNQGCSSAPQLATLLNSNGWSTATGDRWNKRLATVLLRLLFEQRRAAQRTKGSPPATSSAHTVEPERPLTRDEIAHRLKAIGRVSGA